MTGLFGVGTDEAPAIVEKGVGGAGRDAATNAERAPAAIVCAQSAATRSPIWSASVASTRLVPSAERRWFGSDKPHGE